MWKRMNTATSQWITTASLALSLAGAIGLYPTAARAHCDTLDGPVVADARVALEKGDVKPALKWVQRDAEGEITAAFKRAMAVRGKGGEARDLADTWFFETLIRVHRAGEGAPFTGLKPAGTPLPHAVVAADKAIAGSLPVDDLAQHVSKTVADGIRQRFATVMERKKRASTSVEAGREYVAAYVDYVHYVEGIAAMAAGKGGEHHAAAAAEHGHE